MPIHAQAFPLIVRQSSKTVDKPDATAIQRTTTTCNGSHFPYSRIIILIIIITMGWRKNENWSFTLGRSRKKHRISSRCKFHLRFNRRPLRVMYAGANSPAFLLRRGPPWIAIDRRGSPWIAVDRRGSPWIAVDRRGSPWIAVDRCRALQPEMGNTFF